MLPKSLLTKVVNLTIDGGILTVQFETEEKLDLKILAVDGRLLQQRQSTSTKVDIDLSAYAHQVFVVEGSSAITSF